MLRFWSQTDADERFLKSAILEDTFEMHMHHPPPQLPVYQTYPLDVHWHMIQSIWRSVGGVSQSCSRGTRGLQLTMDPQLRRVVGSHPNFRDLEKMFSHGFDYVLKRELTEAERVAEVEAQLERGNHKSATKNQEEVQRTMLAGDVKHSFGLPIQEIASTTWRNGHPTQLESRWLQEREESFLA